MAVTMQGNQAAEWRDTVAATERRNGAVDLSVDDSRLTVEQTKHRHDGTFRVRLIQIRADGQWIVERPFVKDGSASLAKGMPITGVIGAGSRRWAFDARIASVELSRLNARARIPVLRLSVPERVRPFQRRAFFRVSTAGLDLDPATLWPLLELTSARAPQEASRNLHKTGDRKAAAAAPAPRLGPAFQGKLNDVSGNGLSVRLKSDSKRTVDKHDLFWVELRLPAIDHPLVLVARRVRVVRVDPELLVGMTFVLGEFPSHEQFVSDAICRFAADEQRRQLQRQR
jgi:c-di-GMP-binding flagellar brake protein YcgR